MAETYTLKVLVDDSAVKALEQRLQGIMGIRGGTGGGQTGNQSDIFKNITKLGIIATGIAGLVTLVQKIADMTVSASPMLSAMLKLFDNVITLILRPIGDFIGFTLRPIMLFILQYIALPFYRYFTPFMQKYGTKLGDALLGILVGNPQTSPSGSTNKLGLDFGTAIQNFIDNVGGAAKLLKTIEDALNPQGFTTGVALYIQQWENLFNDISAGFTEIKNAFTPVFGVINSTVKYVQDAWGSFINFFGKINASINPITDAWNYLYDLFASGIGNGMKTIASAWDKLYGFFAPIINDVTNIFMKAWQKLIDFWNAIINFVTNPGKAVSDQVTKIVGGASTQAGVSLSASDITIHPSANPLTNIENLTIHTVLQLGTDAQNFLKDPVGFIQKTLQDSLRRYTTK